jgi:hypothetical protein
MIGSRSKRATRIEGGFASFPTGYAGSVEVENASRNAKVTMKAAAVLTEDRIAELKRGMVSRSLRSSSRWKRGPLVGPPLHLN